MPSHNHPHIVASAGGHAAVQADEFNEDDLPNLCHRCGSAIPEDEELCFDCSSERV